MARLAFDIAFDFNAACLIAPLFPTGIYTGSSPPQKWEVLDITHNDGT